MSEEFWKDRAGSYRARAVEAEAGISTLAVEINALRARLAEAERLLYAAARRVPPAFLSCDELTADGDLRYWHDEYTAFRIAGRSDNGSAPQGDGNA
jgi:hypothetical protein